MKWSPHLLTRDFTLVWWGQMVSQVGDGVSKLALLWFVYSVTGSPLKTTMIGLLQTLPPILFGPFIGVVVDRVPKKLLLISSDLVRAVVLGVIPCLIPVESFSIERLYLMVFVHAVASAVFGPALTAALLSPKARHGARGSGSHLMGFGFEFETTADGGVRCYWKEGVNVGVSGMLSHYPRKDVTFAVLAVGENAAWTPIKRGTPRTT